MLDPEDAAQLEEFLAPSRIAVVGTISPSGMPQLTPNWYVYQDGWLSFSTTKERVKYKNLSQNDRISVCVYSGDLAEMYATIRGHAEICDDDSIWPVTRTIVERYVPPEGVEARMAQLRSENRVIVSFRAGERGVSELGNRRHFQRSCCPRYPVRPIQGGYVIHA